jgi:hypothetical protein
MTNPNPQGQKVFISYSWTSQAHEEWVMRLATGLQESGVDVILDKWDLREGADKYAYMEKMVTDPSVRKVVVVCDRLYAEKADGREGGVGTESQIISHELYEQTDPTDRNQKFVPVITEKDEQGKPYVPTYLKGRIYIDMSEAAAYSEGFEQLLRWIFDKPLHKKPPLGKLPAFLVDPEKPSLNTTARHRFALDALRLGKGATAALKDYFDTFAMNLEVFRIQPQEGKEFDDQVIESIENFLPYRDEAIEVFLAIGQHVPPDGFRTLHRFLERLLPYCFRPSIPGSFYGWEEDNLKFIVHELFLYAVAALLKNERFDGFRELTEQEYFFPRGYSEVDSGMIPFIFFAHHLKSLELRNKRLELRRLSLQSDLLNKQSTIAPLGPDELMQADFTLFLRGDLEPTSDNWIKNRWWPVTLLYADRYRKPFEIFARAQSVSYFERLKLALGIENKDPLIKLGEEYRMGRLSVPRWGFESFSPSMLMNLTNIATKP